MAQTLQSIVNIPIIKIARIAGQFAKPRSNDFECKNDVVLPSYRGDMVNSTKFTKETRKHNPNNLLIGYNKSASSLNYIKTQNYNQFYVSHEALILEYESALTRLIDNKFYNLSTHFPWIGNRTRNINGAHIEYIRGINNPIAIKIDSTISPDELIKLIELVNPLNEEGKLVLITRIGAKKITECLPNLIKEVNKKRKSVIWMCDPMHGNTIIFNNMYKIRYIEDIKSEIENFFLINKHLNNMVGGIHLEVTYQNIHECFKKSDIITKIDPNYYKTYCDPRLNKVQVLDLILFIAHKLKEVI